MTLLITAREILAAVGGYNQTLLQRPFGPMQREEAKATERGEAELLAQLLRFFSKNCDGSGAEGRRASRDAVSGVTAFLWARRGWGI